MSGKTDAMRGVSWPLALPYVRIALVALAALATAGILAAAGQPAGVASVALYAALFLAPVNVVCLLLVRALVHREGETLRALIGFERARLGRDILWGLLWLAVLYLPFVLTIMGAILIPSIAFALQHAFFASTVEGAVVYIAAFFVWGVGSGLIYLKQRRLMPLIVCHFLVNFMSTLPALILPFVLQETS